MKHMKALRHQQYTARKTAKRRAAKASTHRAAQAMKYTPRSRRGAIDARANMPPGLLAGLLAGLLQR